MQILALSLQNYRNIELARFHFGGDSVFCVGANGQGKTNLLEALGLITALRSFRTMETKALIREGTKEARLIFLVEHPHNGQSEIQITFSGKGKEVVIDGSKINRFGDFIGCFPTVAMSSQDIQLLRGAPALRRRFMDLVFSAVDPVYYEALRQYGHALKSRNRLLKRQQKSDAEMKAFELILAQQASVIHQKRRDGVANLSKKLTEYYATIAEREETPLLEYQPDVVFKDYREFLEQLESVRERDTILQTTSRGPHRDDIALALQNREAREYASEGQQRGLVIALRLAQAAWFKEHLNVVPVILADDILGELDGKRKMAFWKTIEQNQQVFATGTQMPQDQEREWEAYDVSEGVFTQHE
jgi:DNA replication and repair protein RecF